MWNLCIYMVCDCEWSEWTTGEKKDEEVVVVVRVCICMHKHRCENFASLLRYHYQYIYANYICC